MYIYQNKGSIISTWTYPLPDENIMYNSCATEHDTDTDNDRCNDGRCWIEVNEREQNDALNINIILKIA